MLVPHSTYLVLHTPRSTEMELGLPDPLTRGSRGTFASGTSSALKTRGSSQEVMIEDKMDGGQ